PLPASPGGEGEGKRAPGNGAPPSPLGGERAGVSGENTNDVHSLWNSTLARQHILPRLMRRFASKATRADLPACAQLLNAAPTEDHRTLLLAAFEGAFKGRAFPPLPDQLVAALAKSGQPSLLLRVRRGDAEAIQQSLTLIADPKSVREERLSHIRVFGEVHQAAAVPVLLALAKSDGDIEPRKAALGSLTRYDDATIGTDIAAAYPKLPAALQPAAQSLLTSRASWSLAFLQLVEAGAVKPANVSADAIVRIRTHTDKAVIELTRKLFPISAAPRRADTRAAME